MATAPRSPRLEQSARNLGIALRAVPEPTTACDDRPSPELIAIDKLIEDAAAADRSGDHNRAQSLRQEAVGRLNALRPTARAKLPWAAPMVDAYAEDRRPTTDGVDKLLAIGSREGRMGMDAQARADLAAAIAAWRPWAIKELSSSDLDWTETVAAQAARFSLDDVAAMGQDRAHKLALAELTDALTKFPCPPSKGDVARVLNSMNSAVHRGVVAPTDSQMMQSFAKIAEPYFRQAAQTASSQTERDALGREAVLDGFQQLGEDIQAGRKVDLPSCGFIVKRTTSAPLADNGGTFELYWVAYACHGVAGAWAGDLTIVLTLPGGATQGNWILHYKWAFSSVPGSSTAQPAGHELIVPGDGDPEAAATYMQDTFPVDTDGHVLRATFPVKEGTEAAGYTATYMEAIRDLLAGDMPVQQGKPSKCK